MWSVWFESMELYLGQGLSMLKRGGKELVIRPPTTLPFGQVLEKLAQAGEQEQMLSTAKRCKLHVTLSGALCPAIAFSAPPEVRRWTELQNIAQASAAMVMGVGSDQIVCEMDNARAGLASGVVAWVMQSLQGWATQHHFQLVSVRPLWAVASNCPKARQSVTQGLLIQEPDAVTILMQEKGGPFYATTLVGANDQLPALTRRWLISQGISEENLLKLSFSASSSEVMPQGPKAWSTHWDSP